MTTNAARHDAGEKRRYPGAAGRQVRQQLEHERDARVRLLATFDRTAPHEVDELLVGHWHSTRRTLEEIDAALRRLDDGTYGTCPDCLRPILAERLEILPYARFCVSCQRRRDEAEAMNSGQPQ